MKKNVIIGILLTFCLVLTGVFFVQKNSGLKKVSSAILSKKIASNEETLVYIGRPTCPYCKIVQPKLERIAKDNYFKLLYYNTDDAKKDDKKLLKETLNTLGVESVPTLVLLKGGQVDKSFSGTEDLNKISKYIGEHKLSIF